MAEPKAQQTKPDGLDEDPIGNRFLALVEDPSKVSDPREVQMQIMARILGADDFDAALDMADAGALSTGDLADIPFTIDGISWHKSAPKFQENSVGVFALLTVTPTDGPNAGQQVALTTGGHNVLATLYKGIQAGAIPDVAEPPEKRRRFTFRGVGTASGQTTYWLARAS
jgi:hypothetical protein